MFYITLSSDFYTFNLAVNLTIKPYYSPPILPSYASNMAIITDNKDPNFDSTAKR
jgi:hypothetical protein